MADLEGPSTPPPLFPCSICNRTFLQESLAKHYVSCEKNASKKRRIFDSTKQRVQGTDLAEYLPVIVKAKKVEKVPEKKPLSKWKEQHLEFVRAIRAARGVNDGETEQEPAMTAITRPSNHEQCPTCERHFGPKAYDRHIEWCREKQSRLPHKPNVSTEAVMAKERLDARTKYRAPPLNKSRREITKEKYSVTRSGGGEPSTCVKKDQLQPAMPQISHARGSRSIMDSSTSPKETVSASSFRRTPHRSSYRQSSASPVKRPNVPPHTVAPKEPRVVRSRGVSPQKGRKDVKESPTANKTPVKNEKESTPKGRKASKGEEISDSISIKGMQSNQSKASTPFKKTEGSNNRDSEEKYDPFLSAKRQLMELLAHGEGGETGSVFLGGTPLVPSVLETSPTSAFSKYTSSPNTEPETPTNEMEFGDLIVTGHSAIMLPSSKSSSISDHLESYNNIRDIAASLSSLSISSLDDINLQNGNSMLNNSSTGRNRRNTKYREKLENAALSLRRSVSLFHPGEPLDDLDSEIFEDFDPSSDNENDLPTAVYPNSSFSLSSLGSMNSLNQTPTNYHKDEFEEERSATVKKKMEDLKRFRSKPRYSEEDEFSSADSVVINQQGKCNADSAYSSLNRKSPPPNTHGNVLDSCDRSIQAERMRLSSSGSDSSEQLLPLIPVGTVQGMRQDYMSPSLKQNYSPRLQDITSPQQSVQKMSKFCHECGSKFPLTVAKFCCECGVKRLVV